MESNNNKEQTQHDKAVQAMAEAMQRIKLYDKDDVENKTTKVVIELEGVPESDTPVMLIVFTETEDGMDTSIRFRKLNDDDIVGLTNQTESPDKASRVLGVIEMTGAPFEHIKEVCTAAAMMQYLSNSIELEVIHEPTERIEEHKAFEAVVRPLMEYMANEHHPHKTCIVTSTTAELVESEMVVSTEDYIKDLG